MEKQQFQSTSFNLFSFCNEFVAARQRQLFFAWALITIYLTFSTYLWWIKCIDKSFQVHKMWMHIISVWEQNLCINVLLRLNGASPWKYSCSVCFVCVVINLYIYIYSKRETIVLREMRVYDFVLKTENNSLLNEQKKWLTFGMIQVNQLYASLFFVWPSKREKKHQQQ